MYACAAESTPPPPQCDGYDSDGVRIQFHTNTAQRTAYRVGRDRMVARRSPGIPGGGQTRIGRRPPGCGPSRRRRRGRNPRRGRAGDFISGTDRKARRLTGRDSWGYEGRSAPATRGPGKPRPGWVHARALRPAPFPSPPAPLKAQRPRPAQGQARAREPDRRTCCGAVSGRRGGGGR